MLFAGCRQKSGHGWDLKGRGSAALKWVALPISTPFDQSIHISDQSQQSNCESGSLLVMSSAGDVK